MSQKPILLSTGEPAGIGPELCLSIARSEWPAPLVAVGDAAMLAERAARLYLKVEVEAIDAVDAARPHRPGQLTVLHCPLDVPSEAGALTPANSASVLRILDVCADACAGGTAAAMVTAPLHKGVIIDAGFRFTGHTEYLAERSGTPLPVMLLLADSLRVALATTHLPLRDVGDALTTDHLVSVVRVLNADLKRRFGIERPAIGVCGLNPHAGEGGHLGREEELVIEPALARLSAEGIEVLGPLPADTAFTPRALERVDAVLAMYHDQGLPVIKYAGFGDGVNVTLGLPFVRTSVDHGTAVDIAGTGQASDRSLRTAIDLALELARA